MPTTFPARKQKQHQTRIQNIIKNLVTSRLEEVPFIVFLFFLITFVVSRIYVYITRHDILEAKFLIENVYIRGVHVHHLNFGIFILVIVGFAALYDLRPIIHRRLAILYGIGLGLTFDEFALWLKLQDDYYARISYDAVIIISVVLLNIIYFPNYWRKMGGRIKNITQFTITTLKNILNAN